MKLSKIILIVSIICPHDLCYAQFDLSSINSCVSLDTSYFNRQNPAVMSPAANIFYSEISINPYIHQIDGLNSASALISHRLDNLSAALSIDGISSNNYSEIATKAIVSYKINNAVLGASANYSNINFSNFGSQNKLDISFGASLSIYEHLVAGFSFQNALGAQYINLKNTYSRKAMFGMAWQALNNLSIEATAFVRINYFGGSTIKIHYKLNELVSIAGAICTNPAVGSFETSISLTQNLRVKLCAINHEALGWSPTLSLGFLL